MRTSISQISQRYSLINQRDRRILYHQMCFHVSLFPCCLWMLIDAIFGFDQHSHAHTFSLCLSATLPYLLPFIRRCAAAIRGNRNTHFSVFSSIISKVAPLRNSILYKNSETRLLHSQNHCYEYDHSLMGSLKLTDWSLI